MKLEVTKGDAKASLQYVLGMTSNLYAIRGEFSGIDTPIWLRLYRHRDTAHLKYMSEDGKTYTQQGHRGGQGVQLPHGPADQRQGRAVFLDSPADAAGEDVPARLRVRADGPGHHAGHRWI